MFHDFKKAIVCALMFNVAKLYYPICAWSQYEESGEFGGESDDSKLPSNHEDPSRASYFFSLRFLICKPFSLLFQL